MQEKLTGNDLLTGFSKLGVKQGMMLEVHCSLKSFGFVEGGADTVISALKKAVGEGGAIVMPSFRLSRNLPLSDADKTMGLTAKIRILSPEEEHSAMGLVADTFRQRPDVVTGEGLFRVSAWGKDSAAHAQGFQHLIDHGGYALLLGVDIYRLSAMHYVEDALPQEIRDRFAPPQEARAIYPEGQWFVEAWEPSVKPWYKIQDMAYEQGLINDSMIGSAKCMLMPVNPVISLYRHELESDPYGLYGLKLV